MSYLIDTPTYRSFIMNDTYTIETSMNGASWSAVTLTPNGLEGTPEDITIVLANIFDCDIEDVSFHLGTYSAEYVIRLQEESDTEVANLREEAEMITL